MKKTTEMNEMKEKAPRRINRKWRYGTAATLLSLGVIAAVILLNVATGMLEKRFPLNLDLTADDTFTLSDATREVAAGVAEPVEVVVFQDESYYASPGLANEGLNTVARQFYEGMKQLGTASGGKITARYFDYADNPTLAARYADYDVDENSILFLGESGRHSVTSLVEMFSYDDTYYMYYGQVVVTESLVEQTLATQLRRVTGELAPVVMMTGHGEDNYTLQNVKAVLTQNAYNVVECDLTKNDTIEEEAITMVIPAPSVDYSDAEIVLIRDWLQQNGEYSRNLVLLTNYTADCPHLYELVNEEYGIRVVREVIGETKNYMQNVFAAYGDIPDGEFTSELTGKRVLSQYTQRLVLDRANDPDLSLYNTPLVTFGSTAQLVDLNAASPEEVTPYNAETYPVIGAAYAHKQVPSPTAKMTVDSYVFVWGSMYFLDPGVLNYVTAAENEELFVSTFNAVSGATGAATISSRSMNSATLSYDASTAKWVGIGVFTVLLPLITLTAGAVIFFRRRHL